MLRGNTTCSLRVRVSIWLREASPARKNARASGKGPTSSLSCLLWHAARTCTFHDIPQMESLLAG